MAFSTKLLHVFLQTLKAMEVGKKGKVHVEDIVFLIRKDPKKYARVKVRKETYWNISCIKKIIKW